MAGLFIPFLILVVALIIFGAISASKAKQKRQMALAAWSDARGWNFEPAEVSSIARRFPAFGCFKQGNDRYAYNVMRGSVGDYGGWAMDYHYTTTSTDSKGNTTTHHHNFSAVIIDSGLRLSPLGIKTESFFDKMKGAFGFDDIDFESAEFSRAFWVTAENKRWAYEVIHQGTMEFLLESPRYTLEMDGPYVLAWRGRRFKPAQFEEALALATGILDRLPKDIRRALAEG